jgi:hypothetical protein
MLLYIIFFITDYNMLPFNLQLFEHWLGEIDENIETVEQIRETSFFIQLSQHWINSRILVGLKPTCETAQFIENITFNVILALKKCDDKKKINSCLFYANIHDNNFDIDFQYIFSKKMYIDFKKFCSIFFGNFFVSQHDAIIFLGTEPKKNITIHKSAFSRFINEKHEKKEKYGVIDLNVLGTHFSTHNIHFPFLPFIWIKYVENDKLKQDCEFAQKYGFHTIAPPTTYINTLGILTKFKNFKVIFTNSTHDDVCLNKINNFQCIMQRPDDDIMVFDLDLQEFKKKICRKKDLMANRDIAEIIRVEIIEQNIQECFLKTDVGIEKGVLGGILCVMAPYGKLKYINLDGTMNEIMIESGEVYDLFLFNRKN